MKRKIQNIINNNKRKTFFISDLEDELIDLIGSKEKYYSIGGYNSLVKVIKDLKQEGKIDEIVSSNYLKRNPKIKEKWKKVIKSEDSWSKFVFFKYSDILDLSFYKLNKKYQNENELEKIKIIYDFIKSRGKRRFVNYEERCLELFNDEKLYKRSNNIFMKIKINKELEYYDLYEALKMKKDIDDLVFYKNSHLVKNILIVENKATFNSYKRYLKENDFIFEKKINCIIYGQGKSIINKGSKIKKIIKAEETIIYYLGDIDPEGLGIYYLLSQKNKDLKIKLLKEIYKKMLNSDKKLPYLEKQNKNDIYLKYFISCFEDETYINEIKNLWEKNLRIPQEVIGYEVIK